MHVWLCLLPAAGAVQKRCVRDRLRHPASRRLLQGMYEVSSSSMCPIKVHEVRASCSCKASAR